MEELDYSGSLKKILYNQKIKGLRTIVDNQTIRRKLKKNLITGGEFKSKEWVFNHSDGITIDDTLMGFSISGGIVIFSKNEFCITNGVYGGLNKFKIEKFKDLEIKRDGTTSDSVFLNGTKVGNFNRQSIDLWNVIAKTITSNLEAGLIFDKSTETIDKSLEESANKNRKLTNISIIVGGALISYFAFIKPTFKPISACDCLDVLITNNTSTYKKCLDQDYDKAFDYAETYLSDQKFTGTEAVLQSYWLDKCNR